MDTLIDFYEIKSLSARGRETEVANFEAHHKAILKAILETYSYALTLANAAEMHIASQFAEQL